MGLQTCPYYPTRCHCQSPVTVEGGGPAAGLPTVSHFRVSYYNHISLKAHLDDNRKEKLSQFN